MYKVTLDSLNAINNLSGAYVAVVDAKTEKMAKVKAISLGTKLLKNKKDKWLINSISVVDTKEKVGITKMKSTNDVIRQHMKNIQSKL